LDGLIGLDGLKMTKVIRQVSTSFVVIAASLAFLASAPPTRAQSDKGSPVPYASIKSRDVNYFGPGRETEYDLAGSTVRIGLLVPLQGPQKADGEAIVAAARMALDDDAAQGPLPEGRRLTLAVGDESGPSWGRVADVLIHLVMDEQAVAVVTSANGATAHLSEQVGNRIGVATLTLATDKTTTQIDLPWIFRLGPSDVLQARTIAESIYRDRGFRRVLLVTESDHDGRVGGEEFLRAANELHAPPPARLSIDPVQPDAGSVLNLIRRQSPETLVFWTRPNTARELLQAIREAGISLPSYLSQETAQRSVGLTFSPYGATGGKESENTAIWTVALAEFASPLREGFPRRYQMTTGAFPSPVAAEAYDAVGLIARAVRQAGPNRARVRDRIANVGNLTGGSGTITFDNEGNARARIRLVRLQ
jgi:branched-chain amino acid transport system substrate-binding protein